MVVCIDEFAQRVHQPAFGVTKLAAPPREVREPDDDGPNDDPPSAIRLAA